MIKLIKSNKLLFLFSFIMCVFLLFNPMLCANACLNGISVWAFKVMPMLFPFFVLTRLLVQASNKKPNFMDKFFSKTFHAPSGSFLTYVLSIISGYPMGAKLICDMKKDGLINSTQATRMLSFCSVSGPMFIIGTVGIMMLNSAKAGIIILIANVLASLANGFVYRGKQKIKLEPVYSSQKSVNVSESVYDSLVAVLMVGAYISLSFLFIDILNSLKVFNYLSTTICWVFKLDNYHDVVVSSLKGLFEITSGILSLSSTSAPLFVKTILASGLIGFGGASVFLQSLNFLSTLKISVKTMLKQKTTQSIFCFIFTLILCLIFL